MTRLYPGTLALALIVCSCGFSDMKRYKQIVRDKDAIGKDFVMVRGDPYQLLGAASLNRAMNWPRSNVDLGKEYLLIGSISFQQAESVTVQDFTTSSAVEQANVTNEDSLTRPIFKFEATGAESYRLIRTAGKHIELTFKVTADKLVYETLNGEPLPLLHFSYSESKDALSFLFGTDTALYWLVFAGNKVPATSERVDEKYVFLLGSGIPARHSGEIKLRNCSVTDDGVFASAVTQALDEWTNNTGKLGGRPLSYVSALQPDQPAALPFSDLDGQCLSYVPGYLLDDPPGVTLGIVVPFVNPSNQEIVASPLFIPQARNGIARRRHTLTHELGHVFGLGHQFARDSSGATLYKSVMGYEDSGIDSYDREAITLLYGR